MSIKRSIAAAALLAAAATAGGAAPAAAQGTQCQGRVFIDAVLQNGMGGNEFQYFFHIRNGTGSPMTADVQLQNFPGDVQLFSPTLVNIQMQPWATVAMVRFGRGTNGNITNQTVAVAYDAGGGGGPTVRVVNCRAG
ncbi:MAG: hypothetical protein K2X11_08795 [Acetobacteraceae bacterium]|nr:hypothetical protein [Acetobacteraceae bacterium]